MRSDGIEADVKICKTAGHHRLGFLLLVLGKGSTETVSDTCDFDKYGT
jgi:hypothetical protein